MLQKIKQLITVAAFGLLAVAPLALTASVSAAASTPSIDESLQSGTCLTAPEPGTTTPGCTPADSTEKVNDIVADVINIFSWVVGVVSVIMIIFGGFKYITSGGESSNITGAKNTIMYALIGLVIVALAQFIVQFVLVRVTD